MFLVAMMEAGSRWPLWMLMENLLKIAIYDVLCIIIDAFMFFVCFEAISTCLFLF
jgi:hypothetical protein